MRISGVPDVRYASTRDGLRVAYSIHGDGPPLLFVRGLNSHAQQNWTDLWRRPYLTALAHAFTVITFDARGNGMSEDAETIDLEGLVTDVGAVADELEIDRYAVFGQGFGSPVAIAFAARRPAAVTQLILYAAYARGADVYIPDFFMDAMRENPQAATAMMGHATYPDTPKLPSHFLTPAGLATTPETAMKYLELARTIDVSEAIAEVRAPALVMQPLTSGVIPFRAGEELAAALPDATLESVTSGSYNPWAAEASEPTLKAISAFVGREIPLMPPPRPMAVLVTDLVGSTEMTHRLGEERARTLFREHDSIVRAARRKFRGEEVKHTGDGIMIRFDEPASAVDCALAIQRGLDGRAAEQPDDAFAVRVGISYGDVVEEHDGLFGTTVVLAVRVMDEARAGEVLVSESVCTELAGSHRFGPARRLELKGFPEPAVVHAAEGA